MYSINLKTRIVLLSRIGKRTQRRTVQYLHIVFACAHMVFCLVKTKNLLLAVTYLLIIIIRKNNTYIVNVYFFLFFFFHIFLAIYSTRFLSKTLLLPIGNLGAQILRNIVMGIKKNSKNVLLLQYIYD